MNLMFGKKNSKNNQNNKMSEENGQSVYVVVSDASDHFDNTVYENQPQKPVHPQQKVFNPQNSQQKPQQKPIRMRPFEEFCKRKQAQKTDPRPAKKIKLNEDSEQPAQIIRFNSAKQEINDDEEAPQKQKRAKLKKAVPWMTKQTRQIQDPCLRFHNQVVEFYQYIRPNKREHQERMTVFNEVSAMILQKYPQAQIKYFGSFATKLYLPDGDIDITVLLEVQSQYQQRKVYDAIYKIIKKHEGTLFCDIDYIRNSKVPLVKFLHIETQVPFDISVNKQDGLKQIEHVKRMKKIYPQFEAMVFVLKTMLKIRNMSETYTGGIGSFLLSCMVLHFLRYVHKKQFYYTMGEYVMKFMEFYAIANEWDRKSVYVDDSEQIPRARQPGTISFLSPQDHSHDIGKSAFKIKDVFNVWKNRFRVISGKNFQEGESILKELINPALEEFRYYKYEKAHDKRPE